MKYEQQRIKLSPAHAKKLMDAKMQSDALNRSIQIQQELVQKALAASQRTIQEKIQEYNGELQTTWTEIAKVHGIDIRNVLWDFDAETGEIYVKAIQFNSTDA